MSTLSTLTATEIVEGVRARTLRAEEVVTALLERIERLEPAIQAWATLDPEGARHAAAARDRAVARGETGLLHGVPVGVKDIIDVAGLPTIAGFQPRQQHVATQDATVVARLRAEGAIILGKTHTTQFAHGDPAPTRNPWNRERTPGGSSSGSGAAVAAQLTPVALGTQTAGSVLRPAAYCGVVGFKPTFNWASRDGVLPLAWSLDHVGLLVRSVADAALLFGALTGQPPTVSAPSTAPRIGLLGDFLGRAEPEVARHLTEVADRLRDAGAHVDEVHLPVDLDLVLATHHVIMRAEVAAVHAAQLNTAAEHYGPALRREIEAGQLIGAAYYLQAQRIRRQIGQAVARLFAEHDVLLLPTASNVPPPAATTGDRSFQAPWTMLGTPALTLPTGLGPDRLPIGSQLIGRQGADQPLLRVAAWCQRALGTIAPPELS